MADRPTRLEAEHEVRFQIQNPAPSRSPRDVDTLCGEESLDLGPSPSDGQPSQSGPTAERQDCVQRPILRLLLRLEIGVDDTHSACGGKTRDRLEQRQGSL